MNGESVQSAEIIRLVRMAVDEAGGINAFARFKHISPSLVSQALNGGRGLSDTVAATVGYMQVTRFIPIRKAAK